MKKVVINDKITFKKSFFLTDAISGTKNDMSITRSGIIYHKDRTLTSKAIGIFAFEFLGIMPDSYVFSSQHGLGKVSSHKTMISDTLGYKVIYKNLVEKFYTTNGTLIQDEKNLISLSESTCCNILVSNLKKPSIDGVPDFSDRFKKEIDILSRKHMLVQYVYLEYEIQNPGNYVLKIDDKKCVNVVAMEVFNKKTSQISILQLS